MIKNLEAAKKLVKKYRSITKDDVISTQEKICEDYCNGCYDEDGGYHDCEDCSRGEDIEFHTIAQRLTGYGNCDKCTLCKDVYKNDINLSDEESCEGCIYMECTGSMCNYGENEQSYEDVGDSKTVKDFLKNLKKRADHLESLINNYNKSIKNEVS